MRAEFRAEGDVVIVTGGASGIGAATAAAIVEAGGMAVSFDLNACGRPGVLSVEVDVSDRQAVHDAVERVVLEHGSVSGLVASAAIQPRIDVVTTTEDEWRRVMDVDLNGVVWACQAVLPTMIENHRGSIVLFTSGLASVGRAGAAAYAASKGAMIPFAKSLAAEVAEHRVRVNVIAPGVIDTPQFQSANPTGGEREHWTHTTGIGLPEDVVGPLLFLLSDAASMTGSLITRDRAYTRD